MNNESKDDQNPDEQNQNEGQDRTAEEFVAELIDDQSDSAEVPVADAEGQATSELVSNAIEVVTAAPAVAYDPSVLLPPKKPAVKLPPSPMANLAAKGGSVGALVLGVLSFAGSFITSYAILNSFMGLALGLWGLRSNHKRMALIGLGLCLLSAFFCVLDISAWLQSLWPQEEF